MKQAFIVYLLSHNRPISELLDPQLKNDLEELTDQEKEFILSFKRESPKWKLFPIDKIKNLPSIQWKMLNLKKMSDSKHKKAYDKLEKVLLSN